MIEALVMKPFIVTEIQQKQNLTAIFTGYSYQLSISFFWEDGIMLLKLQSIYQKQMPNCNCIVY
jgi:hypothetical protein